jgi:glycyl-tRNA synthetase beta chain
MDGGRLPFLLEIGVEEIPHWMIPPALGEIDRLFRELLSQAQLEAEGLHLDATPRRLVVRVAALQARQADREELVLGPPAAVAFKDGQPTGAAAGFAKKLGLEVDQLRRESTPKGEYAAAVRLVEGRATSAILAEALPEMIARIPWPKTMYWTGRDGARFIRPIRWIAALLGDSVVGFEFAGVKSGALSRGHRRLGADEVVFEHSNYEERLEKNGVILGAGKRRQRIVDGIRKLLRGTGLSLAADEALLSDLVHLTEFPTPVLGSFDAKFLALPREVLSTVMRHHQRYFTLTGAEGGMAPHFIAVMNMKADRKGYVKKGNERVLEARFNDARFFWEADQKKPLAARVEDLANVTFQAQLGSYLDKTRRVRERAVDLAARLGADAAAVARAAELCKADLTTEMVKEFTGLQGIVGGLYARAQGEPEAAARAIYDHYLPQSMEDRIPETLEGRVLALADKLDTLESCFSVGLAPTGSKDPFALRRAAQGVVKILTDGRIQLPLEDIAPAIREFLADRIRYYFRDVRGFRYDELNAVFAAAPATLPDFEDRLMALHLVRQTENFEPLAASFKRIRNILRQAGWTPPAPDPALFEESSERSLWEEFERLRPEAESCFAERDYMRGLQLIASLRPAVDRFFDDVLVNAPDPAARASRLNLLGRILTAFSSIADFSEIVTESTSE